MMGSRSRPQLIAEAKLASSVVIARGNVSLKLVTGEVLHFEPGDCILDFFGCTGKSVTVQYDQFQLSDYYSPLLNVHVFINGRESTLRASGLIMVQCPVTDDEVIYGLSAPKREIVREMVAEVCQKAASKNSKRELQLPSSKRTKERLQSEATDSFPMRLQTPSLQCQLRTPQSPIVVTPAVLSQCKVIGQVANKFILIHSGGALYVLDQHACDERVRVEDMYQEFVGHHEFNVLDAEVSFIVSDLKLCLLQRHKVNLEWWFRCKIDRNLVTVTPSPIERDMKQGLLDYVQGLQLGLRDKPTGEGWRLVRSLPQFIIRHIQKRAF